MLSTLEDIQTEVLVRGNRSTSTTDITDAILNDWLRNALLWATAQRKWPMTEGRISTTYTGLAEFPHFEGWKPDGIRLLQIDGKRYDKKNFYKYQAVLEDNPNDEEKIFSDYGGLVFINPTTASGTLTAYGQYTPVIDPTDKTAVTVFSSVAEEANEAVVEKMLAYLKKRDKLFDESLVHETSAKGILDGVWNRIGQEQFGYQDTGADGVFKRIDVLGGSLREDTLKRDQW